MNDENMNDENMNDENMNDENMAQFMEWWDWYYNMGLIETIMIRMAYVDK